MLSGSQEDERCPVIPEPFKVANSSSEMNESSLCCPENLCECPHHRPTGSQATEQSPSQDDPGAGELGRKGQNVLALKGGRGLSLPCDVVSGEI